MKLSRCGNLLAFTMAHNGHDDLHAALVRDLNTGHVYKQAALDYVISIEWAADGKTLLATQPDQNGRPARVVAIQATLQEASGIDITHKSNLSKSDSESNNNRITNSEKSALNKVESEILFEESDPRFFLELQRTKDWQYLAINSNSKTSSEVYLIPADGPITKSNLICVQSRRPGLEYFLEHRKGKLYILSNAREAENYALYTASIQENANANANAIHLGEHAWKLVLPERSGVALEDLDVFEQGVVVIERVLGKPQFRVFPGDDLDKDPDNGNNNINATRFKYNDKITATVHATDIFNNAVATNEESASSSARGGDNDSENIDNDGGYVIPLPNWALSVVPGANGDFWSDSTRLILSSPIHPDQTADWNFKTRQWDTNLAGIAFIQNDDSSSSRITQPTVLSSPSSNDATISWTDQSLSGYNPDDYVCKTLWAPIGGITHTIHETKQGIGNSTAAEIKVPITLIHASNLGPLNDSHPCLVIVYAAYGHSIPLDFFHERLPLLNRGWVIAMVHARGGGELGRRWHAAGRGPLLKPNSALDVESAVKFLINQGYTRRGLVAVEASSAGAVAAGGALNNNPGLFGAALLESPFVDVLSTMCDPDLPLTQHEYDEFGNPSTPEGFKGLQQICPFYNIDSKKGVQYPPVMIICSTSDERVPYWGPLKYAARLRAAQQAQQGTSAGVLVVADAHQGHLPSERERYDVKLLEYAFLISTIRT